MKQFLAVGLVMFLLAGCASKDASPEGPARAKAAGVDQARLTASVQELSAPIMEGRGLGTEGVDRAGAWIEQQFEAAGIAPGVMTTGGLAPVKGAYRQPFDVVLDLEAVEEELAINEVRLRPRDQFVPLGISGDGKFEAEAVFVGFGVVSDKQNYDSYSGMPDGLLKGKVAVAYRYEPSDSDGQSQWHSRRGRWSPDAALLKKAQWAAERGAVALVVVDPPWVKNAQLRAPARTAAGRPAPATAPATQPEAPAIPAFHATPEVWRLILDAAGLDPQLDTAYLSLANRGELIPEQLPGIILSGTVELERPKVEAFNVIAHVPGRGKLAGEIVVVGAHYDHVGFGAYGSRSPQAELRRDQLHPGADDNASGTAVLVEVARLYQQGASDDIKSPRRCVVFMAFTGEERGLLGSHHFMKGWEAQSKSLGGLKIAAMINLDMVGRLHERRLQVNGVASSTAWPRLIADANTQADVPLKLGDSPWGPSDHQVFYRAGIPAVHLFTGLHNGYHMPDDTPDTVDYVGLAEIAAFTYQLTRQAASRPDPLPYKEVEGAGKGQPGIQGGVMLGIVPAYEGTEGGGAGVNGVSPNTPASRAGLKAGDVIVSWNGQGVADLKNLADRLSTGKPGRVMLGVKRDSKMITLPVDLVSRDEPDSTSASQPAETQPATQSAE